MATLASGTIPGEIARYSFDERSKDGTFASLLAADKAATSPQENTLVLSEEGVVGYRDGRPFLMFR